MRNFPVDSAKAVDTTSHRPLCPIHESRQPPSLLLSFPSSHLPASLSSDSALDQTSSQTTAAARGPPPNPITLSFSVLYLCTVVVGQPYPTSYRSLLILHHFAIGFFLWSSPVTSVFSACRLVALSLFSRLGVSVAQLA